MRFSKIVITAIIAFICSLIVLSCSSMGTKVELSVSAQSETVPAVPGEIFVSIKCNSSWTIELEDATDGSAVGWARLNMMSGEGNRNLLLEYELNQSETLIRKVRITVSSGDVIRQVVVEQQAAGKQPVPDPDKDPVTSPEMDLTKTGWLELPAMDNPALGYYSHNFQMNGKTYRNYSFGWSQKDRVALWVAYPLSRLYLNGNAGRTNAWALDPLLGEDSSAPFSGYAGDYARGHQIPSADRQCCYEANAQTFYGTNMTPQLNEHNEGIWQDLENRVRVWANTSDTLYVVTGVIVSSSSRKEEDSYGNSVTIPDAYFKTVLKYSRSSTLGTWNAAAFYLEHKSYTGGISESHSMSIDELEEITGIDFFVNLPAKVGEAQAAKLEAVDPVNSSVWW